jgi:CubicO group peptidase (beta-lactamase class C family)
MTHRVQLLLAGLALAAAAAGCGGSSTADRTDAASTSTGPAAGTSTSVGSAAGTSTAEDAGHVRFHEPSQGWTASVPAGWTSVRPGSELVRDEPLVDPTRLLLRTYRGRTPEEALAQLAASDGLTAGTPEEAHTGGGLHWERSRGSVAGTSGAAAELAVAQDGADTHVAVLVGRETELADLVQTALLPALDSFVPGQPDPPRSVLAAAPPDPAYWPTGGWRTATPASQGLDGARLDAMLTEIRAAELPIDSVTVVSHGYVVLDEAFEPFASNTGRDEHATGQLHELQSATKSVTSMLLGIALHDEAAKGVSVDTTVATLAAAIGSTLQHMDSRKRALTVEDLLTMRSGLAWRETGYPYEPGSGNDVMAMLATDNWTEYVSNRPMADQPGTTFAYNTGAAHLVSGVVTMLTQRPAVELAEPRLFAPLGIRDDEWQAAPEGVTSGGFGLRLAPDDLARLAFLYLHGGRWDARQVVPADWVRESTTDRIADPLVEYGYLWWLDQADGYAYMSGLRGQLAAVVPADDLVVVITARLPADVDASVVTRWLLERYVLPATTTR